MIPGFNHNIKHKGRVFHVQTEDSGPKNPHIITHLFVGGNILASKKTRYDEIVGQPNYEKTVRSMMEEQHKQMLRNLINGAYDHVQTGEVHHLNGPAPVNVDPTKVSPSTAMMAGPAAFTGLVSQQAGAGSAAAQQVGRPQAAAAAPQPVDIPRPPGGIQVATTPPWREPSGSVPVAASMPPPVQTMGAPLAASSSAPTAAPVATEAQPVAQKTDERPTSVPATIFGEDLISEKSLDEVILSYLAEDIADSE